ncbi:Inosine/uridine-preferring nucleoside hydrolase [Dickeya chrysanthemi Ech1591]|uniref:Inosine/uridine-preferring nucleoside hydrolase n=1 Tax=Dickeya chrysanthemi (strain Ech1591) TaxID=561229 RepID=C6CM66_DICC1|nr:MULTISPECIES: nucleoside hydrolase [Dickeya]ACT07451.1 Inosine/uridine-preferring nucleoside hydrolase [Dickeya chrysanthemi Ech1591]TYL42133.1 nucleoside hydrolase [Dickeya sp. ws52]WJM86235.1 nucleoside hydrolase [Dickeya chrysanthemi]
MRSIPIIIDCDPGIDDALALLSAFVAPQLVIEGITVVNGNQPLPNTLRNALQIVELGERTDIPVFAGCWQPMLREPIHGQFHGKNGLGDSDFPTPRKTAEIQHAVNFLIARCRAAAHRGERITLCSLGPLTNLASAFCIAPDIVGGIERIVSMGGACRERGNRTMTSEFNLLADPHAAHIVFSQDVPMTLLPLDATHQMMLTPERVGELVANAGRLRGPLSQLMAFWDRNDVKRYGSRGGPLHDPLVIAWVLRPDLFQTERARVFVEHQSELCMGQSVMDIYGKSGLSANVDVVTGVAVDEVFQLFCRLFAAYGNT